MNDADDASHTFVAFAGDTRLFVGDLAGAAAAVRCAQADDPQATILVFDRATGEVTDLDLRGTEAEIAARYARSEPSAAKRGRPKLGVVSREVTLLPRHWDWLSRQPGGASVTLRRLVEAARKPDTGAARTRTAAAYRFMSAMAGDLPGFEEAARALFAGDRDRMAAELAQWPADIGEEILGFLDASPA
jgi:hypothetical protein